MTKLSIFLAALALTGAAAAQSAAGGLTGTAQATHGGFTGPMALVTAEHAKTLPDDTKVTLQGQIDSHLGGKDYLFKDASGTVSIEVDSKRWQGQAVAPLDRVQIDGEVERQRDTVKIEVKQLQKL